MTDFDWFLRVLISFNQSEVNVYLTKNKHDLKKNIHIIGSYPNVGNRSNEIYLDLTGFIILSADRQTMNNQMDDGVRIYIIIRCFSQSAWLF